MSQLKEYYQKEVVPGLFETFKYKNIMQVPKLDKVVLNMGLGSKPLSTKTSCRFRNLTRWY